MEVETVVWGIVECKQRMKLKDVEMDSRRIYHIESGQKRNSVLTRESKIPAERRCFFGMNPHDLGIDGLGERIPSSFAVLCHSGVSKGRTESDGNRPLCLCCDAVWMCSLQSASEWG